MNFSSMIQCGLISNVCYVKKKEEEKKEKLILEKDIQDDYIYFKCKQN